MYFISLSIIYNILMFILNRETRIYSKIVIEKLFLSNIAFSVFIFVFGVVILKTYNKNYSFLWEKRTFFIEGLIIETIENS